MAVNTYGIDLGTTYSCIAYMDESGRPAIARNRDGQETTPSVVYFESPSNVIVGGLAKESAKLHPDLVSSLVKRQMGKQVKFRFHGAEHTPETVSALILRNVAEAAAETIHQPVENVVITVPAYFGVAEREATRKAGEIAGLNVLNVVPEPVAAALHYEALTGEGARTIFVYDLGGGTFDTTVIALGGSDVRVVCTDGDAELGGSDWDDRTYDHLVGEFAEQHPGIEQDEHFLQGVALQTEQLKRALSSAQSRRYNLMCGGASVQGELTREAFEQLTEELLERTLTITARTMKIAEEHGVTHFDDVLLVGGATRMPAVAQKLRERFGFEPKVHDPDLAVAKGAAKFALIETVKIRLPEQGAATAPSPEAARQVARQLGLPVDQVVKLVEKRITTVAPRAFGIKLVDKNDPELKRTFIHHLLHANDALPADTGPQRFGTVEDHQTEIQIEVWEQTGEVESTALTDNTHIGEGVITGLPPLPADSPLEVSFVMDELGRLLVHAVELSTGKDLHIELVIAGLDQQQVATARNAIASYAVNG